LPLRSLTPSRPVVPGQAFQESGVHRPGARQPATRGVLSSVGRCLHPIGKAGRSALTWWLNFWRHPSGGASHLPDDLKSRHGFDLCSTKGDVHPRIRQSYGQRPSKCPFSRPNTTGATIWQSHPFRMHRARTRASPRVVDAATRRANPVEHQAKSHRGTFPCECKGAASLGTVEPIGRREKASRIRDAGLSCLGLLWSGRAERDHRRGHLGKWPGSASAVRWPSRHWPECLKGLQRISETADMGSDKDVGHL
jgi:hypothetical protein